jgi:hypothetical protein
MSFVTVVARPSFISLMSDGRMMHGGVAVAEDVVKFRTPRPGCFVAFGGHKDPADAFLEASGLLSLDISDPRPIAADIRAQLLSPPFCHSKILLAFGGRAATGQVAFVAFSTLEPEPQLRAPGPGELSYGWLYNSRFAEDAVLEQKLVEYLGEEGCETPAQIQKAQWRLQLFVADHDATVNRRVFTAVVS